MPATQPFIQDFLNGDAALLGRLYKTVFPKVARYVVQKGGTKEAAEDIFQNALIVLYVQLKKEALHIQSFDNYLFIVCRNLWRREATKKNRVTNNNEVTLVSERTHLARFYIEQSQWDLFQEKLKMLSQNCQEILALVFKKIAYKEIMEQLGYASETVARQRVFKCKSKLTQLIKNDARYVTLRKK
ncbi:MAG: sigma-70 family RNA polymerase sigma factor [Flavobacteriaceae bacterium]